MNKDNAAQYLPLVHALAEGRTIQYSLSDGGDVWFEADNVVFNMDPHRYRIKPEPRRAWVWWPRPEDSHRFDISVRHTKAGAMKLASECGGHITEVTE